MKEVNLEKIFYSFNKKELWDKGMVQDFMIPAMKQACEEALDLAAESVSFIETKEVILKLKDKIVCS